MDDKFLNTLDTSLRVMQTDIKYIRQKIDAEKLQNDKIIEDHEGRIRNIERVMYKGLGIAILLSIVFSAVISTVMAKV